MAHAWKACWVKALGGSNPPSSAFEVLRHNVNNRPQYAGTLCSRFRPGSYVGLDFISAKTLVLVVRVGDFTVVHTGDGVEVVRGCEHVEAHRVCFCHGG